VPLIIYDPYLKHFQNVKPWHENSVNSISDDLTSDNLVELVDLFPTLCELANIPVPPCCSPIPSPQMLCTEGESLVPIMYNKTQLLGKSGAFSQYPRPSKNPTHKSDKPKLGDINIMGYSLRTERHRYTEWVEFQDLTPNWKKIIATEIYDHLIDPNESINLFGRPGFDEIKKELSIQLRAGWRAAHSTQYEI
jgi:iduronate 2-sulfatase